MATQLETQVLELTLALQKLIDQSLTVHQLAENENPSQDDEVGVWSSMNNRIMKMSIRQILSMIQAGNPVQNIYQNIATMLADQSRQSVGFSQRVLDSSGDPTSGSEEAIYMYKGSANSQLTDYIRLSDSVELDTYWDELKGDQKDINLIGFTDGNVFNFKNFQTDSNNNYFDIATDNKGVWVATSYDGTNRILRSDDDGHTWTEIQASSQNQWLGIDTDEEGTWVSVSNNGNNNRIMRSVDNGITWTGQPATGGQLHQWADVATDRNGTWIAVATNGNPVIRSIDNGVTWSIVPQPVQNSLYYVYWSKDGVFIATDWQFINLHITKDYGVTWEIINPPISRVSLTTDHDQIWVMAIENSNQIYISRDNSETWNTETIDIVTEDIRSVKKIGAFWVVITDNYTYYSYDDLITFEKSNEVIPAGSNMATSENGTTIIVSRGSVNVSRISDRIKFENIVNEYQINGKRINPVNKVLNIEVATTEDLDDKVDKETGKGLSDQNYTLGEKNKLAGLESSKWLGLYPNLTALENAHPTALAGNYADVDTGVGVDTIRYVWDVSDDKFVQSGSGAPLTGAQIKVMYEAQPDTNAFDDTRKNKLDSITEIFTTALKNAYDGAVAWISTNGAALLTHLGLTNNPHNVTKAQVGLGNVPNIDFSSKLDDIIAGSMISIDKSNQLEPIVNALSQFLEITQEDYDNLPVKNPNIIYIILPVEVPNLYILNDVCQPGSGETETIGVDWVVFEDAILSIASGSDSNWSLKATAEESTASVGGSVRLTVRDFEVGEQYRVTMDSRSTDDSELLAGQGWFEARPAGGFAAHRFFDIISFDWEQHSIIVEPTATECYFSLFVSYTSGGPQTGWSCYLDNIVIEKIS